MARAIDYSVGPGLGPTALTKMSGGAIRHAPGFGWIWSVVCEVKNRVAGPSIGVTALSAALTQEIDLNVAFPNHAFPLNVQADGCYIKRITDFEGPAVTAATVEVGDTGDPDGLLTTVDVFTGALATATYSDTTGAAEYGVHVEAAYVPTLTLTAVGDNLEVLTAGSVMVCVPFRPLHD